MRYERPIFIAGILPSCSSLYPVLVLIRRASHICSMFITSGYLRSITQYAACGVSSIAKVGGSGGPCSHSDRVQTPYAALSQILRKECFQLFKRNDVHLIVKVSVICTGDNEQFLVIAGQLAVRCFAEIAGVRLFPVYQQHGRANLAAVLQNDSEEVTFQPPLEFRLRGW